MKARKNALDGKKRRMSNGSAIGARKAAFRVLSRVVGGDAYADILLDKELEGLKDDDRPLATEITYGVLRWVIKIDWIIDSFSSIRTKKLEHSVLNALRIGVYQLYFLTRVPVSAAINESVNLIKGEGARKAGFVNAVLRKAAKEPGSVVFPPPEKDPVKHISVVWSHPEWMVGRWIRRWGVAETAALCEAGQRIPEKTLRTNTLLISRDGLLEELGGEGRQIARTRCSPDGLVVSGGTALDYKDPRYYIQDEASQLIPYLVSPKPGETVLDACSAPGGKTAHMAQLMKNSGRIYALDKYRGRLKSVEETAKRLKIDIIETLEADSSVYGFAPPFPTEFDAILCDAPCSGLGVLRRAPDIKLKRTEDEIKSLSGTQKKLLGNLSRYLKRGGGLVYSTCTFEPEETEEVVEWFLKGHPDFNVESACGYVPEECRDLVDGPGFLRTYPHRHGMDGFFAVRLKRL